MTLSCKYLTLSRYLDIFQIYLLHMNRIDQLSEVRIRQGYINIRISHVVEGSDQRSPPHVPLVVSADPLDVL